MFRQAGPNVKCIDVYNNCENYTVKIVNQQYESYINNKGAFGFYETCKKKNGKKKR